MDTQVSSTCWADWLHVYQIVKLRKYLTEEQTKSIIHTHVTSWLDQNNSLLTRLPKKKLCCLTFVQNSSTRLITDLKKRDHVTPALVKLHWLPIAKGFCIRDYFFVLTRHSVGQGQNIYAIYWLFMYLPADSGHQAIAAMCSKVWLRNWEKSILCSCSTGME